MPSPVPSKNASIKAAASASPYKHLREQQLKVVENIGHSFSARNGDHLDLLIKTGSTQNKRAMSQTNIRTF